MNIYTSGATIWARKTLDSDIFFSKPAEWFKIWFYIVNKVNHKNLKQFKRGQGFFKYEWIENKCQVSLSQIDHCIRWLKWAKQIATHKARRGLYITVLQYNLYQDLNTYKSETESETESEIKAKHKRDSINKYDKYEKNDNNINNGASPKLDIKTLKTELVNKLSYKNNIGIHTQWQSEAFRIAEKLKIELTNEFKGRWLKLFKEAFLQNNRTSIYKAYSFLYDYPKELGNTDKVKLFFWKYANPSTNIKG